MKFYGKIFTLLCCWVLIINSSKSFGQCSGILISNFPATIDGVNVIQTYTGSVFNSGTTYTQCGVVAGQTMLGSSIPTSFTQTLTFSNPVNNILYILNACDSNATACETFNFTVDLGILSCSQGGSSCLLTQIGNSFHANSVNLNGTYITITSSIPYTSITVSGPGGNNGSFMALCSNSNTGISLNGIKVEQISVYPNPNNGSMFINYKTTSDASIEITDITGNLVGTYNLPATGTTMQIQNGNLQSGMYLYRVISNNALIKQGKIVVMK